MEAPAEDAGHQEPARAPLQFDLASPSAGPSVLDEEREKHRKRAERFGASFVEPTRRKELALEAKKEHWRRVRGEGFATGFDPFSQEELDKKRERAARFNIPDPPPAADYRPDDDIAAKTRRAAKFGVEYEPSSAVLMDMDLFEERKEVPREAERRPNGVYLYGVDVMSTKDVLKYFEDYGPEFVEWINDSSCNVLFADAASAKRAMLGTGRPLPPVEGSAAAGLDPTDLASLPFLWHQGRDFAKDGTPIHLIYRVATVEDVKDTSAPKTTRELWKTGSGRGRGGGGRGRRGRRSGGAGYEDDGQHPGSSYGGEAMDEDGDVEMAERPAKRRRERRKRGGPKDLEMQDAEADGEGDGGGGEGGAPPPPPAADLREVLQHRGDGGAGTGAAAAGSVDMGPPRAAPVGTEAAAAPTADTAAAPAAETYSTAGADF